LTGSAKGARALAAEFEIVSELRKRSEAALEIAEEQPVELSEAIDGLGCMYTELLRQVGADSVTYLAEEDVGRCGRHYGARRGCTRDSCPQIRDAGDNTRHAKA
jgi:hypothetical protein